MVIRAYNCVSVERVPSYGVWIGVLIMYDWPSYWPLLCLED